MSLKTCSTICDFEGRGELNIYVVQPVRCRSFSSTVAVTNSGSSAWNLVCVNLLIILHNRMHMYTHTHTQTHTHTHTDTHTHTHTHTQTPTPLHTQRTQLLPMCHLLRIPRVLPSSAGTTYIQSTYFAIVCFLLPLLAGSVSPFSAATCCYKTNPAHLSSWRSFITS